MDIKGGAKAPPFLQLFCYCSKTLKSFEKNGKFLEILRHFSSKSANDGCIFYARIV